MFQIKQMMKQIPQIHKLIKSQVEKDDKIKLGDDLKLVESLEVMDEDCYNYQTKKLEALKYLLDLYGTLDENAIYPDNFFKSKLHKLR